MKIKLTLLLVLVILMISCEQESVTGVKPIHWIEVGSSGAPAFENGWGNYSDSIQGLAFGVDQYGFLHIIGTIQDSTPSNTLENIFILPEGYRPTLINYQSVNCFSGSGEVNCTISIHTDGRVIMGGAYPSIFFNGHIMIKL